MTPDDEFTRAIDAEIEVLLRLSGERREAPERLGQILESAPGRFTRLLEEAGDDLVEPLALLLKRLGRPAFEVVVDACLAGEPGRSGRALRLLEEVATTDRSWHADRQGATEDGEAHATVVTYLILDLLLCRGESDEAKARVLVALMEACRDAYVASRVTTVLLCCGEAGLPALLERYRPADNPLSPVTQALCALGTPFCQYLLEGLKADEVDRQKAALLGMRAYAYAVDPRSVDGDERGDPERDDHRFPDLWPPLSRDLAAGLLSALKERVAAFLRCEDAELRDLAITSLGRLESIEHAPALRELAGHDDVSTRVAAIQALAEIGDPDSAAVLIDAARCGTEPEQCAALAALGRQRAPSARGVFADLARNGATPKVREEAINGLGQLGGDDAHALLLELMRTGDRQMRRKAARWATGKKLRQSRERDGGLVEEEPTRRQQLASQRLNRLRGATRSSGSGKSMLELHPAGYNACIRIDHGIRVLPELRPYPEYEFTQHLAGVCHDYAFTRRLMAEKGLIERADGVCTLSETGAAVWRVERYIMENYPVPIGVRSGVLGADAAKRRRS